MRRAVASVPQVPLVAFRLGADEFALDVERVHEVLREQPVRVVPQAPEFVDGVLPLRELLVPVLDLRRRFGLGAAPAGLEPRILIVDFGGEPLGLRVDAVSEVLRVPEPAVSPPPAYFRGLAAEYLRGLVRLPERLLVLLDVERLLSSQERIAFEATDFQAAAASAPSEAGAPPEPA